VGEGREGEEEDVELLRELEALEMVDKEEKKGGKEKKKEEGGVAVSYDLPDISHLPPAVGRETEPATSTSSSSSSSSSSVGIKKALVG